MSLDQFTQGYIECALWSSTAFGDESVNEYDSPDASFEYLNYSVDDMAAETLAEMVSDCADFQETNADLLTEYYFADGGTYDETSAGHDFWLTRNGHGAGFWDRGLGKLGDDLSDMARPYGEVNLYVGDGGEIHS